MLILLVQYSVLGWVADSQQLSQGEGASVDDIASTWPDFPPRARRSREAIRVRIGKLESRQ